MLLLQYMFKEGRKNMDNLVEQVAQELNLTKKEANSVLLLFLYIRPTNIQYYIRGNAKYKTRVS